MACNCIWFLYCVESFIHITRFKKFKFASIVYDCCQINTWMEHVHGFGAKLMGNWNCPDNSLVVAQKIIIILLFTRYSIAVFLFLGNDSWNKYIHSPVANHFTGTGCRVSKIPSNLRLIKRSSTEQQHKDYCLPHVFLLQHCLCHIYKCCFINISHSFNTANMVVQHLYSCCLSMQYRCVPKFASNSLHASEILSSSSEFSLCKWRLYH